MTADQQKRQSAWHVALLLCTVSYLQQCLATPHSETTVGLQKRDDSLSRVVAAGQQEEIFSLGEHLGSSNYDEYPMVVPKKRASLLLDRLMVALHSALEKERRKIGDFYAQPEGSVDSGSASYKQQLKQHQKENTNHNNKHYYKSNDGDNNNSNKNDNDDIIEPENDGASLMYSDDDPSVMLDYDFKDLNSINRATGQTLVARSFQRRGNDADSLDGGAAQIGQDGISLLRAMGTNAAVPLDDDSNGDAVSSGGGGRINIGHMYWRCYFNAVSCF